MVRILHGNKSIKITHLLNQINEEFDVGLNLRLYNFYGFEIFDDSDLDFLDQENKNLHFIYFTLINDCFEEKNLLRCYKIGEKLGQGGFGKVYIAQQKFTNYKYALKFFRQSFFSASKSNYLFKEIEILKKLDHPNIIKLYSYFVIENDRMVLVLEYANGGTLRSMLLYKTFRISQ